MSAPYLGIEIRMRCFETIPFENICRYIQKEKLFAPLSFGIFFLFLSLVIIVSGKTKMKDRIETGILYRLTC